MYLPAAIRYGISYDTFWNLNPRIMGIYQKEYIEKLKYDNECAWRSGVYMYDALKSSLSSVFGGKKSKAIPYPKEPYRLFPMTDEEKEEKAEQEKQKAIAFFDSMEKKAHLLEVGNTKSNDENKKERPS